MPVCKSTTLDGHQCCREIAKGKRKYCWQHGGGRRITCKNKNGQVTCKQLFKQAKCSKLPAGQTRKGKGYKCKKSDNDYTCELADELIDLDYMCEYDSGSHKLDLEGAMQKRLAEKTKCPLAKTKSMVVDTFIALSCLFHDYPTQALEARWQTELENRYKPRFKEIKKKFSGDEALKTFFNTISIAEDEKAVCYYSRERWNFILGLFEHGGCNCACGSYFYMALAEIFGFGNKVKLMILLNEKAGPNAYHGVVTMADLYFETTQKLKERGQRIVPWRPIPDNFKAFGLLDPVELCLYVIFTYYKDEELDKIINFAESLPKNVYNHKLFSPFIKIRDTPAEKLKIDVKEWVLERLNTCIVLLEYCKSGKVGLITPWFHNLMMYRFDERSYRYVSISQPVLDPSLLEKPQPPDFQKGFISQQDYLVALKRIDEYEKKRAERNRKVQEYNKKVAEYTAIVDKQVAGGKEMESIWKARQKIIYEFLHTKPVQIAQMSDNFFDKEIATIKDEIKKVNAIKR